MSRVVKVKYSQQGTKAAAHKYHCTIDGITITFVQSSHSNLSKLNLLYITKNGNVQHVPDISSYTEEELFQYSMISNVQIDIEILHKVQKHMMYCYDNHIFRRTELTLEY